MPNRLANATSPYLLQHADNPVDWYPWGPEAFQKAEQEDKPIFLSVGYSSCHWCHVMAHESFEDEEVAAILNENFVAVKLDREERPDVDEAYMAAVQLTSGRGGWPMSVFMTPDRRPFFAGTYFPRDDRGGHPGFVTVCEQLALAWRERRDDIESAADQIATAVRESLGRSLPMTGARFDQRFVDDAVKNLLGDFDPQHGGFGGAPKFPPHTSIEFLLSYATQTMGPIELREAALTAALVTLQKMSLGGIHDHVGGGFHRYSTDERWLLPHFEKMLYDNALMLGNLARASVIAEGFDPTMAERFRTTAAGIVEWLTREMTSPEGLLYSAQDADSEGEEGKFYVWTEDEVRSALGDRAEAFMRAYGFEPGGNFQEEATGHRTGANIPYLTDESGESFDEELETLLMARARRVWPGLDDKALVSWNGIAIGAMAEVGLLPQAARAAEAILAVQPLPHQIAKGHASGAAFLDDYAFFADGLFRLSAVAEAFASDGETIPLPRPWTEYRDEAERIGREMVARFYDELNGGFFGTSSGHEELFGRTKPVFDQPVPSGNAAALRVLTELGDEARARQTITAFLPWMERVPQATEALLDAALTFLDLPEAVSEAEPDAEEPAPVVAPPREVEVTISAREIRADANGAGRAEVTIRIPEGLHLNSSEPPARWLTPTRIDVRPLNAKIDYPSAQDDRYVGEIRIPFEVRLPSGESGAEFEVKVTYQACTESECLLPQERTFSVVIEK